MDNVVAARHVLLSSSMSEDGAQNQLTPASVCKARCERVTEIVCSVIELLRVYTRSDNGRFKNVSPLLQHLMVAVVERIITPEVLSALVCDGKF